MIVTVDAQCSNDCWCSRASRCRTQLVSLPSPACSSRHLHRRRLGRLPAARCTNTSTHYLRSRPAIGLGLVVVTVTALVEAMAVVALAVRSSWMALMVMAVMAVVASSVAVLVVGEAMIV